MKLCRTEVGKRYLQEWNLQLVLLNQKLPKKIRKLVVDEAMGAYFSSDMKNFFYTNSAFTKKLPGLYRKVGRAFPVSDNRPSWY